MVFIVRTPRDDVARHSPAAGGLMRPPRQRGILGDRRDKTPSLVSGGPGTMTRNIRIATDTMGDMEFPAERFWGAQTQRSLENFKIGGDRMPIELIHALAQVKRAAAQVNLDLGKFKDPTIGRAIIAAADEVIAGRHDD